MEISRALAVVRLYDEKFPKKQVADIKEIQLH